MSQGNESLTRRQLLAMLFCGALATTIRPLPGNLVMVAGNASWVSAVMAIPVAVAYVFFIGLLFKNRQDGEGLAELIIRILGNAAGKALIIIYTAWLIFFSAVVMRAGSESFASTIYPASRPRIFVILMLMLATIAAIGRVRALARFAELLRPLLLFLFLFVLIFGLKNVNTDNLLPVSILDTVSIVKGTAIYANTVGVMTFLLFMGKYVKPDSGSSKAHAKTIAGAMLIISFLITEALASLGAELTVKLNNPFFIMVRDLSVLNTVERIEAIVVAFWVLTDYIFISCIMVICSDNLALCLGIPKKAWLPLLLFAALAVLTSAIAPVSFALNIYTNRIVPVIAAGFSFGVLPALLVIGKLRRKI